MNGHLNLHLESWMPIFNIAGKQPDVRWTYSTQNKEEAHTRLGRSRHLLHQIMLKLPRNLVGTSTEQSSVNSDSRARGRPALPPTWSWSQTLCCALSLQILQLSEISQICTEGALPSSSCADTICIHRPSNWVLNVDKSRKQGELLWLGSAGSIWIFYELIGQLGAGWGATLLRLGYTGDKNKLVASRYTK